MERLTVDVEHTKQQTGVNSGDWRTAAERIRIIEQEIQKILDGGNPRARDVNFVDIKTMKPPVFTKHADNFQSWVKKAKNYLEANCDGIREALEEI